MAKENEQPAERPADRKFGIIILVVMILAALSAVVSYVHSIVKHKPASVVHTVVCSPSLPSGTYGAPIAVLGVPTNVAQNPAGIGIQFADNYVLTVAATSPGFYLGKLGLFQLADNKIVGYAIVSDPRLDPCPKPSATPAQTPTPKPAAPPPPIG